MKYFLRKKDDYWELIDEDYKLIATSSREEKILNYIDFGKFERKLNPKDFTESIKVEWVKWTKEKPWWNGSVYIKFNGKNESSAIVSNGVLISISGEKVSEYFKKNYEDTFYWLKQDHNFIEDEKYSLEDMKSIFFNGGDFKELDEFNYLISEIAIKYEVELKMNEGVLDSKNSLVKILKIKDYEAFSRR